MIKDLPEGSFVLGRDNHVLARYILGALYVDVKLHAPQRLMLAEDGVYLIHWQLENHWFQNIQSVKEKAQRFYPNLATQN